MRRRPTISSTFVNCLPPNWHQEKSGDFSNQFDTELHSCAHRLTADRCNIFFVTRERGCSFRQQVRCDCARQSTDCGKRNLAPESHTAIPVTCSSPMQTSDPCSAALGLSIKQLIIRGSLVTSLSPFQEHSPRIYSLAVPRMVIRKAKAKHSVSLLSVPL